jgi:hypothetical protein
VKGTNPATRQAAETLKCLAAEGVKPKHLFLDIEADQYTCWTNHTKSIEIITDMYDHLEANNVTVGVYASAHEWSLCMGTERFGRGYLWYPHYDNTQNFDDFGKFGGWDKPFAKQYIDAKSICGINVDRTWSPYNISDLAD